MYQTSDTPNQSSIPDDALIEMETATGNQEHFLGGLINDKVTEKTRFAVITQTGSFTPSFSDGNKAFYRITGAATITIPTATAGGYSVGDELTLVNRDSSTKIFDTTGVTVNVPPSWTLNFNEVGSPITLICVGSAEWDAFGDFEVA